jgi:hypothetical protein
MTEYFFYILGIIFENINNTASYWLPVLLVFIFWKVWLSYVRADWVSRLKWILLEVRLPKEVFKTPVAMELVLNGLQQPSGGNKWDQYWKGRVPDWFSFEIVSIEGTIRVYIRCLSKYKNIIEAHIYSQYPEAIIGESSDYTENMPWSNDSGISLWGSEFTLTQPDPYPIKTYTDYGMDKGYVDEKQRIETMAPTLEFLGSMGKGEQTWIQILVRATRGEGWKAEGKELIEKLMQRKSPEEKAPRLTKGETDIISAIERSISKPAFEVGIRGLYFAEEGKFNPANITALLSTFKQYSSHNLNGFKPGWGLTKLDYPWDDFMDIRKKSMLNSLFNAYRLRSYFYPPYEHKPFVLNIEELATIFHFPSGVAETPTLTRVDSKRSEPPANLPV